jgi:outer membrane protein assembly factor BamB
MFNSNGILAVYDAKTGTRLYQQRLGAGAAFSASPIAAAGKIYVISEEGDAFVIKAGPQYELLATNPIGEQVMSTPAFSGDLLVIRAAKHLIGIQQAPVPK